jgi:hypothetical protein
MNSPFLHEQARRLAAVAGNECQAGSSATSAGSLVDRAEAVRKLYLRALGRPPTADELALGVEFVQRQTEGNAAELGKSKRLPAGNGEPLLSPWDQLAQVLLSTNEFMFVD